MEDSPRKVHAIGRVMARTWYETTQPVELRVVEKIRTGQKKDNISLVLFSKKIDLFSEKVDYSDYDRVETEKFLSIGENLVLPFGAVIETYYENDITEAEVSLEEAKENAASVAYRKALEDVPEGAQIIDRRIEFVEGENGDIIADVIIECLEDIGVKKEIER